MNVREYKYADWFAIFGNGDIAHFEAYNPYQKDTGEFMVQFFFSSNDQDLIDKYDLKVGEEISERNGLIEMHYPKSYVDFLKISSEITRVVIALDLLGNQTDYSMKDMANRERIRLYEKESRIMNIHSHQLVKKLDLAMNRTEEQLKKQKRMMDSLKDKKSDEDGIIPSQAPPSAFGGGR